ncbi:MAG: CoA pyrophosphatase [Bacteroidota bacterium]|nr:CoA pyrophosphatase [Bacteroidota bacterium]
MDSFILQLKACLQGPLPGEEAQFLMAPTGRPRRIESKQGDYQPRASAVLIILFPENESWNTILIERPVYEGVHSGQIAFPGGRHEEQDQTLINTALRETQEEIGIDPFKVEILGKLTDLYISPSNSLVSPYIGFVKEKPVLIPDSFEVSNVMMVDLFELTMRIQPQEKMITWSNGLKIKSPYFEVEGKTVWGATAMMISELREVVKKAKITSS